MIKEELSRRIRAENQEDEMWLVDCDKVENYKKYFPEGNSSNLEYTFDIKKRLESLQKMQVKNDEKVQKKQRPSI